MEEYFISLFKVLLVHFEREVEIGAHRAEKLSDYVLWGVR